MEITYFKSANGIGCGYSNVTKIRPIRIILVQSPALLASVSRRSFGTKEPFLFCAKALVAKRSEKGYENENE